MRLSLWQQFSSNNSSSFTVVGEFASTEDANEAAHKIEGVLKTIEVWHKNNPSQSEDLWHDYYDARPPASPPEATLARQYNLDWPYALEVHCGFLAKTFDNLVFITHDWRPDNGPEPLDDLLRKLGGRVTVDIDLYGNDAGQMLANVTCTAPDDVTAAEIVREHDQRYGDSRIERPIRKEGRQLLCENWQDVRHLDLHAWLEYLESAGCTDIECKFTQLSEFTLVGFFETADDAKAAGEELRSILISINQWYEDLPEDDQVRELQVMDDPATPLTPPEQQFSRQYDVPWPRRITWSWAPTYPTIPGHLVRIYDRFVFISNYREVTWQSPAPIDEVIHCLGGQALVNGTKKDHNAVVTAVVMDISCTAPSSEVASEIAQNLPHEAYFLVKRNEIRADGAKVSIQGLRLGRHLSDGLPELIHRLRHYGCADLDYTLTEVVEEHI